MLRYFTILVLHVILLTTNSVAQNSSICKLKPQERIAAKGGARFNHVFSSEKPNYTVEGFQDTLIRVVGPQGKLTLDKLRHFIVKPNGLIIYQNLDKKWGVMNPDLTVLIKSEYDDLTFETLKPGFNCVVKKNNLWGIIDSTEKILLPIEYDAIGFITDQMIMLEKKDERFLFSLREQLLVNIHDYCIQSCGDKTTQSQFIIQKEGKSGLMSFDGSIILKPEYDRINYEKYDELENEYCFKIRKDEKEGIINSKGQFIIPLKYNRIRNINFPKKLNEILYEVELDGENSLFYNGKILDLKYQKKSIRTFDNTQITYSSLNVYGLYDYKKDEVIMEPHYDSINRFREGKYLVKKDGKFGIVSTHGKVIKKCTYDLQPRTLKGTNNFYLIRINHLYGYVDKEFNSILKPKYHEIKGFKENLARVMLNNKWGFINRDFDEQIELKFDYVNAFNNGESKVILNNKEFVIDTKGNCIRDCE